MTVHNRLMRRSGGLARDVSTATVLIVIAAAWCAITSCGENRGEPSAETGSRPTQTVRAIRVAAAADLKFALDEVIHAFHAKQDSIRVTPIYGSSGSFHTQITQGAPFDIYLSADVAYVDQLIDADLAARDSRFIYAFGRLVIWARKESPIDLESRGFSALTDESVRRIAIANPAHAPYGRAAEAALRGHALYDQVRDRLVLGENIAQAAQFVESGAAEIGIIALSLALSPVMQDHGTMWLIPLEDHPPLEQGGAVLTRSTDSEAARQFTAFLLGDEGRVILARYGFLLPGT